MEQQFSSVKRQRPARMATTKGPQRLDASNSRAFIERYDTILLDCDGVLWSNDQFTTFEGVADTIEKLRDLGKRLYFISNNTTYSAESFTKKFQRMAGFEGRRSEVISINDATAIYLRDIAKVKGKVYVIGTRTVSDALQEAGLQTVGIGPSTEPLIEDITVGLPKILALELAEDVKAVVVSMDTTFDYNKWFKAANYLLDPECLFIATSREPFISLGVKESRRTVPITGCLVAAVEVATGRQATVIGKPSANFFTAVKADHPDVHPDRTVMLGDYLDTDIQFAANCGIDSVLVCCGADNNNEHTLEKALIANADTPQPTYMLTSLADLGKWI